MYTIRLLREDQLVAEAQTGSSDAAYNARTAADLMRDSADDWEILDETGKRVLSKIDWENSPPPGLTASRRWLRSYLAWCTRSGNP
jgi:hypothetical protein